MSWAMNKQIFATVPKIFEYFFTYISKILITFANFYALTDDFCQEFNLDNYHRKQHKSLIYNCSDNF